MKNTFTISIENEETTARFMRLISTFVSSKEIQITAHDETDYLLSDPENKKHLKQSIQQYNNGKTGQHSLVTRD